MASGRVELDPEYKYCGKCGRELRYAQNRNTGYNRRTGEPNPQSSVYVCPSGISNHDYYEQFVEEEDEDRFFIQSIG